MLRTRTVEKTKSHCVKSVRIRSFSGPSTNNLHAVLSLNDFSLWQRNGINNHVKGTYI